MEFSFLELLILVLVGALFFRDIAENYIREKLGLPPKNGNGDVKKHIQEILSSQTELREHFNDETTNLLNRIVESIDKMHDKQDITNTHLSIIKEAGVKCRNG